jgi:thiol-disulfide isomerase/thioredoxin
MQLQYFTGAWCGACQAKRPLVEQVAKELGIAVSEVDVGQPEGERLCRSRGFNAVPAVVLLDDHENILYRALGSLISFEAITGAAQRYREAAWPE